MVAFCFCVCFCFCFTKEWAVSRNRFWGTPLPIWANEDYSEIVAIGSIEELETKAGLPKGSVKVRWAVQGNA